MLRVVERALLAAEHHQPVIAVRRRWNLLAEIGAADLDLDARLAERVADDAEGGLPEIFDGQNAHFIPPRAVPEDGFW
jgi:hypothetical protein